MDMNQLFHHHQMALIAADRAALSGSTPAATADLPCDYARRIEDYRARRGMPRYFRGPPIRSTGTP